MNNDWALTLLPGFDGTGELFGPLRAALGVRGEVARIVRYGRERTLEDYVDTVAKDLPRQGTVLIAESFSGPVALSLSMRYPARIQGAVLCATFATSPFRSLTRAARYLPELVFATTAVQRSLLRHFCLNGAGDDSLLDRVASVTRCLAPGEIQQRLRALSEIDLTPCLKQIAVPVLYLRATQDRIVSARLSRQLTAALPRVTVQEIDGPHLLLQSRPTQCAAAITRFLSDRER